MPPEPLNLEAYQKPVTELACLLLRRISMAAFQERTRQFRSISEPARILSPVNPTHDAGSLTNSSRLPESTATGCQDDIETQPAKSKTITLVPPKGTTDSEQGLLGALQTMAALSLGAAWVNLPERRVDAYNGPEGTYERLTDTIEQLLQLPLCQVGRTLQEGFVARMGPFFVVFVPWVGGHGLAFAVVLEHAAGIEPAARMIRALLGGTD